MAITNPWNLGSVSAEVYSLFPNLPSNLSGTGANNVILGAINYTEAYTGANIGSTSIAQAYHNVIVYKSLIDIYRSSNINGNNAESTSIGDFSTSSANSAEIIKTYQALLNEELNSIGRASKYYRTY